MGWGFTSVGLATPALLASLMTPCFQACAKAGSCVLQARCLPWRWLFLPCPKPRASTLAPAGFRSPFFLPLLHLPGSVALTVLSFSVC